MSLFPRNSTLVLVCGENSGSRSVGKTAKERDGRREEKAGEGAEMNASSAQLFAGETDEEEAQLRRRPAEAQNRAQGGNLRQLPGESSIFFLPFPLD